MTRIPTVVGLVVVLSLPALAAAQPAGAPVAEEYGGRVVAIDPKVGLVCLRRADGYLIEFGEPSGAVPKQLKVGMEITSIPPTVDPPPRLVRTCPFPPPLTMTHKHWTEETSVALATRGKELQAVDEALKRYGEASDDWQRALLRPDVQKAFEAWKKDSADWTRRNAKKAPQDLDAELTTRAVYATSALRPLDQWTGEVVAIDPARGVACVREKSGQMIELGGNADLLKQLRVGMELSGVVAAASGTAGRDARPLTARSCPTPPPLTITYQRWMTDTAVRLLTRDPELRAVDDALKRYWDARDDWQRATLRPEVKKAFDAWKQKEGDLSKSRRNGNGVAQTLDAELGTRAVAGATPDELKAWAVIEQHNRDALADMFRGRKLVLKTRAALDLVKTAHEEFTAAREAAGTILTEQFNAEVAAAATPMAQLEKQAKEVVDAVLGDLKDRLTGELQALKTRYTDLLVQAVPILGRLGGPWGALAKEWKDTALEAWKLRKTRQIARRTFAPGDAAAAFDAMVDDLADNVRKEATKAAVATAFGVGKIATATVPVAPEAIAVAEALAKLLFEFHEMAKDTEDAAKANELIAQGKIDASLFATSALLAAYYLASADTSAVIYLARPFGITSFVRETEALKRQAEPVLVQASEVIVSSSYEIPELRDSKGAQLYRGKKPKVAGRTLPIPTGRTKGKVEDVKDALTPGATASRPQPPTITPETAPPALFALRWVGWTGGAGNRGTPAQLKPLDDAVAAWGYGGADPEDLRGNVRTALEAWKAAVGGNWASNARNQSKAFTALDKIVALPAGAATCPLVGADGDCNGMGEDGTWSDKPRDPSWPPCADPPDGGCKQVVLGRFGDIQRYIGCPGYVTLNVKAWSWEKNDRFIACAVKGRLGATCNPPILVASGSSRYTPLNVTGRETSQLTACGCTMRVNEHAPGFVLACPNGVHGPVACSRVPASCEGPWQDQPRPAHYGRCAEPPWNNTRQVVIGRDDDLKPYLGCPGYITLNLSRWTREKDEQFVACAAANRLGATAEPPILVASTWSDIMATEVVFRQVAQLRMCACKMEVFERGAGRVDRCPAGVGAAVPGLSRLFAARACGGPPPSGWELLVELIRRGAPAAARGAR
jgi:hypothetical protein